MSNFWDNISRYPRFFVSSFAGLIVIILAPFNNLLKVKKFRIVLPIILILLIFVLYFVVTNMLAL